MILYTIGYEGLSVEDFISLLSDYSIKKLVDIREVPQSRKPGFSKKQLALHLHDVGIAYSHDSLLGCPSPIRHQYKRDNDWVKYSDKFLDYIGDQKEAFSRLADLVTQDITCIMCFEQNYLRCHRYYVSMVLKQDYLTNLEIFNITQKEAIVDLPLEDRLAR